ncbi:hypothetical protein cypCar_00011650 [Cyprinus carpio]|nr:hypothetical protein cypCar_00011650 [Cyprinus carpio]
MTSLFDHWRAKAVEAHPMQFRHKRELKKLNMSIWSTFWTFWNPHQKPQAALSEGEAGDLKLLFVHMHHLINEYRPHQARERTVVMMEVQKRQRLETLNVPEASGAVVEMTRVVLPHCLMICHNPAAPAGEAVWRKFIGDFRLKPSLGM